MIDRLQRQPHRLRVEQPHDHRAYEVEHGEDDVRPVADVLQRGRRDLHDEEVAQEVGAGGQGGAFGADLEREDLGGVDPDASHPACAIN